MLSADNPMDINVCTHVKASRVDPYTIAFSVTTTTTTTTVVVWF